MLPAKTRWKLVKQTYWPIFFHFPKSSQFLLWYVYHFTNPFVPLIQTFLIKGMFYFFFFKFAYLWICLNLHFIVCFKLLSFKCSSKKYVGSKKLNNSLLQQAWEIPWFPTESYMFYYNIHKLNSMWMSNNEVEEKFLKIPHFTSF